MITGKSALEVKVKGGGAFLDLRIVFTVYDTGSLQLLKFEHYT